MLGVHLITYLFRLSVLGWKNFSAVDQYLMIVSLVTIFSRRLEGSLRCSQLVSRRTKLRGRAVRALPTYWIIQIRRVVRVLRVSR